MGETITNFQVEWRPAQIEGQTWGSEMINYWSLGALLSWVIII